MVRAEKGHRGIAMEGFIARWYAKNTRPLIDEFHSLATRLVTTIPRGGNVLEIAPGPGYLAIELAKQFDGRVTGIDISNSFVEIARRNAIIENVDVAFQQGDAAQLPIESSTIDFIVCRAAFKNFARPVEVLDEMHRVLVPKGKSLIIDLLRNASMQDINEHIQRMKLGFVNSKITAMVFKHMLLKRAYSADDFEQMARSSQFRGGAIHSDGIGLEMFLTKK